VLVPNGARGLLVELLVSVGKNFLTESELNLLNRILTAYLEFAELQALNRSAMKMLDWAKKLDDFLKLGQHY
jgi:hypothetical protein